MSELEHDKELLEEGIQEVKELIDLVITDFMEIEKAENYKELSAELYKELMRNIHSIKGALGMLGFEEIGNSIHHVEAFLLSSYPKASFSHGICDLMIDYFSRLLDVINIGSSEANQLNSFKGCFECLANNQYKSVCHSHYNSEETCEPKPVKLIT